MTEGPALDRIDRALLRALQANARQTNQALAEIVGLSPSACLARIRRLERSGVIAGYHARLDPARIAPSLTIFAEITLARHGRAEERLVQRYLLDLPEASEVLQVSGAHDYLVRFVVPSMARWTDLADEMTDGDLVIAKVTTVVVMKTLQPFTGLPID